MSHPVKITILHCNWAWSWPAGSVAPVPCLLHACRWTKFRDPSWPDAQKTHCDPYSQSNRKSAILMCGGVFDKFMPILKTILSYSLKTTAFTFTQCHLHAFKNKSYWNHSAVSNLVGVTADAIFPLCCQASNPYNFHMQCPISTKFLINVDSLALNTSTHSFKVSHFEFGCHYEILLYIMLSLLSPTDWTAQTSQSVSVLLGPC